MNQCKPLVYSSLNSSCISLFIRIFIDLTSFSSVRLFTKQFIIFNFWFSSLNISKSSEKSIVTQLFTIKRSKIFVFSGNGEVRFEFDGPCSSNSTIFLYGFDTSSAESINLLSHFRLPVPIFYKIKIYSSLSESF